MRRRYALVVSNVVLGLLLWIHAFLGIAFADQTTGKLRRRSNMDNKIISWRILWQHSFRGTPMCIGECLRDIQCASVYYNKITGKCQGHSITMGVGAPSSVLDEGGTRYFVQNFGEGYIGDSCMTSSDCITVNAECRGGQCFCVPGYSFSPRTHECSANCTQYGEEFMEIPNYFISKCNMETFQPVSISDCASLCTNRTDYTCVSLEYGWSINKCYLQNVTVLDEPLKWYSDDTQQFNISYFQRDCF